MAVMMSMIAASGAVIPVDGVIIVGMVMAGIRLVTCVRVGLYLGAFAFGMRVCITESFRSVERHKQQTEAIERRNEHTEQYAPIGVVRARNVRLVHGFDQSIFRVET